MGTPLMPWQRQVADVALEIDPTTGNYIYGLVIVTVPRQSGKTALMGVVAEHRCLTTRNARVWMTSQSGKDASAWMRDEHHPVIQRTPIFADRFTLRRSAGQEAVRWPLLGSSFAIFPPMRDALHGKQSDLVFVDEAWVFDALKGAELRQAIRPTMATRPGSQLWILSTQGDDLSQFFADYVATGREAVAAGKTSGVAYFEWSIPDAADPEDMDAIVAAHPAVGHTIQPEALEIARADFGDDVSGWARAYGNRATHTRTAAFSGDTWERCGTEQPDLPQRYGLGVDVAPDGSRAAVCAAWRDEAGRPHVEVLREDSGASWVAPFVIEHARRHRVPVGYDTVGVQTLAAADEIARQGRGRVSLRGLTTREFATSCATFAAAVVDGDLRHFRQKPLDDAVLVASRRPILDGGWAWGRKASTGSIAPLVAATVALRMSDDLPPARSGTVLTANAA